MNPYNINITKMVELLCKTAVAIVGIIFGAKVIESFYKTMQGIYETKLALNSDTDWDDED